MPYNRYILLQKERYELLMNRYNKYLQACSDPAMEPVKVFDPLTPKQIEELNLIREVSKQLQIKKDEDLKKAAQQAAEAEEKAKELAAQELEAQELEAPTETTPTEA